jgi:hypothetical protein
MIASIVDFGGLTPTPHLLLDMITSPINSHNLVQFSLGIKPVITSLVYVANGGAGDKMELTGDLEDAENNRLIAELKVLLRSGGWWIGRSLASVTVFGKNKNTCNTLTNARYSTD